MPVIRWFSSPKQKWMTLATTLALLVTACGGASTGSQGGGAPAPSGSAGGSAAGGGAAGVIRVGAALSLTGSLANEAKLTKSGYDLWAEEVNKRGGIQVGDKKYKVEMVYLDDQSSADKAAELTERLISTEKVDFLFSPYGSGLTFAASAIAEKHRKVMFNGGGTASNIFSRGFKYFFSPWATTDYYTKDLFDLLPTLNPKPQTVAVLWKNDLANREMAAPVPKRAEAIGMKVVYNESFNPGTTDFTAALTVIKGLNPDVVLFLSQQTEFVTALRQMKAVGLQPKLLFNGIAVPQPEFAKNVGADGEGVVGVSWYVPSLKNKDPFFGDNATFVKLYKEKYGHEPNYHAAFGAMAGVLLTVAVQKAGSIDADKVREVMSTLRLDETFTGPVAIDNQGKNPSARMVLGQLQNGSFVPIWPKENATGSLVYPKPAWR